MCGAGAFFAGLPRADQYSWMMDLWKAGKKKNNNSQRWSLNCHFDFSFSRFPTCSAVFWFYKKQGNQLFRFGASSRRLFLWSCGLHLWSRRFSSVLRKAVRRIHRKTVPNVVSLGIIKYRNTHPQEYSCSIHTYKKKTSKHFTTPYINTRSVQFWNLRWIYRNFPKHTNITKKYTIYNI